MRHTNPFAGACKKIDLRSWHPALSHPRSLFRPSKIVKQSGNELPALWFLPLEQASILCVRFIKILLYLAVAYALAFALVFSIPEFIHRRAFDRAFSAWYKDPSLQNTLALRLEKERNELIHVQDSAVGALVLLAVGCAVYVGSRRWKSHRGNGKPPLVQS